MWGFSLPPIVLTIHCPCCGAFFTTFSSSIAFSSTKQPSLHVHSLDEAHKPACFLYGLLLSLISMALVWEASVSLEHQGDLPLVWVGLFFVNNPLSFGIDVVPFLYLGGVAFGCLVSLILVLLFLLRVVVPCRCTCTSSTLISSCACDKAFVKVFTGLRESNSPHGQGCSPLLKYMTTEGRGGH